MDKNTIGIEEKTSILNKHKKTDDKNKNIPNSLIIYVKTRIPNAYKMNYEPYMTVPKSKSHTVYFDPIVKYYEGPIKNLPSEAPKDALFTQFFEAPEFDFMINRILSDFKYMQKSRTLQQSYDEGIIENNIKITLQNLFKPNDLFYINKKPYTIIGVKSNPLNWQIDKKPLEKLLSQFTHLSVDQIQKQANEEEYDIPEILRQGNIASSDITSTENMSIIKSVLKNTDSQDRHDTENVKKEISGITEAFVPQDKLPGVYDHMFDLYTTHLRENIPINYSNNIDLTRDPLTLSLLIDINELINYINYNKKKELLDLYSAFSKSKIMLGDADKRYNDTSIELAKYNTNFEKTIYTIFKKFNNKNIVQEENHNLIIELINIKVDYMKIIFKLADIINEIYELQKVYFTATRELLKEFKKEYIDIIKYYGQPKLALKCIDNDIFTVNLLIEKDSNNKYSSLYFNNYAKFKQFYKNQLNDKKQELLNQRINYTDEVKIYSDHPNVLLIELFQYEIYNFQMCLFYSYNQYDIWTLLFKTIEDFITQIGRETINKISDNDNCHKTLNDNFNTEKQDEILKSTQTVGIRTNKTSKYGSKNGWVLVKDDGTNSIKRKDKDQQRFEELYLKYAKTSVEAYDAIILYVYMLEIRCLIQNRVYISEANINHINVDFTETLEEYYETIIEYLEENKEKDKFIPSSLLWDTSQLNNIDFVNKKFEQNKRTIFIYIERIKLIEKSRETLLKSCENISNLIKPNISKIGFIEQCNNIIKDNQSYIKPYSFRSTLSKDIKDYDMKGTNEFIYNMFDVVKSAVYDRIIEDKDMTVNSYLDWVVFDNDKQNIDSLYASVADGLNKQLELTNSETTNPYIEEINNKNVFTSKTLEQLVININKTNEPPYDLNDVNNIIMILETTLKIKFVLFEMFLRDKQLINVGDLVLYNVHSDYKPHRVISKSTNEMGNIFYDLYDGFNNFRNIEEKNIKKYYNNPLEQFRVYCNYNSNIELDDYMYIVIRKKKNKSLGDTFLKYQLVRDIDNDFVFTKEKIPIYVKYLIFNSCPNLRELDYLSGFNKTIQNSIGDTIITNDINIVNKKIKKYEDNYKLLKNKKNKSVQEKVKERLIKEEINKLKDELENIRARKINKSIYDTEITEGDTEGELTGGELTIKPSEQYNSSGYPINIVPTMQRDMRYLPQRGNLYKNPYQNYYYLNQNGVPYGALQNKAKEQKSKLSFYTTIELELFPGESANVFQKSVVKCQSTFERIREAWADIFGFEYRPAPMIESYAYSFKRVSNPKNKYIKNKQKTQNNKIPKQNITRKA
jgi:hypothetical protein